MRRRLRWLALAAVLSAATASPGWAQTPVAIVLGNVGYVGLPRLPGCEVSANLVASTLSRAGVKVTRLDNPSNARIVTAIAALGDEVAATPKTRALIYVCGYVSALSDRLFLVPVEAKLDRPTDLLSQGILARQLMGAVASPDNEAGLVLMDVATPPGQAAATPADFTALVRPAETTHGGLAVATLSPTAMGPAPLAASLADTLGTGQLELMSGLKAMGAQPGIGRSLVAISPPSEPSWFVGSAAPPTPAPVPAAPLPPVAAPAAPAPAAVSVPPPQAVPATLPEPNPAERRRLQLALQRLGYFKGRINGVFGPDTLNAIRQFQRESNNEPTGRLTAAQVEQLLQ